MATQARSGGTQKITVPLADNPHVQRASRGVLDVYNEAWATRLFENQSIPVIKIIGNFDGSTNWPGWVVVDNTETFPGSYVSIQAALDDTVGDVFIHMITSSDGDVVYSDRNVTIQGIVDGRHFPGIILINGDIIVTATAGSFFLYMTDIQTNESAIQLTGAGDINCLVRTSVLTLGDNNEIAENGLFYNATGGTSGFADTAIQGDAGSIAGIYAAGPLHMFNVVGGFEMNGDVDMIYSATASFYISHCTLTRTGVVDNVGSVLYADAASASSVIQYSNFFLSPVSLAYTIQVDVLWSDAKFYFNQSNLDYDTNIVPPVTAFNTVG